VSPSGQGHDLQLILANIYHLSLRPGIETIEQLGGIHRFMNWDRAIVTDSGGFQAFALPKFVRSTDDGITFRSHLDGSEHCFTPELVVEMQERIGVDIATCLDVCTGFPVGEHEVATCTSRTSRGYLHHLLKIADPVGGQSLAIHNLSLLQSLMADLRQAIKNN
jgi:queuine tRNA-ribosyltransferase